MANFPLFLTSDIGTKEINVYIFFFQFFSRPILKFLTLGAAAIPLPIFSMIMSEDRIRMS